MLAPLALVVIAAVLLTFLAATYQPLVYGSTSGIGGFPGLPNGQGMRYVNNFLGLSEDIYIPPQRGTFNLFATIYNKGPRTVTIEAVTQGQLGGRAWPLTPAGPVLYYRPEGGGQQPPVHVLRDVSLGPGQEIDIGMPLRTWPCANRQIHERVSFFFVKERFLFFTHTVGIPFGRTGDHVLMYAPGGHPGEPHTFCAAH